MGHESKMNTPIINPAWLKSLGQKPFFKRIAAMAGYKAAAPTRVRDAATRMGTNTNSTLSQMQRLQLSWDGQYVGKNLPIARAYLSVRQMYCDPKCYMPTTGDAGLDSELKAYLDEVWSTGGINCSMWEAFSRTANVEQPCGGDSALAWYRDETQLRLQEVCSDQIGELYQFTRAQESIGGLIYFAGMFYDPRNMQRVGFRIYDRGYNDYYTNAQTYPASDVIYFQDNLFKAARGITEFSAVIEMMYKTDKLFELGMDSAERQAKVQAVVFNRTGQADELSYEEFQGSGGELTYVEKIGYGGPVTEFRYTGDDYKLMSSTAPGDKLIDGCKYGDEKVALGLRLPYSFLVNAKDVGGASNRLEINKAGHELERIQNKIHRPRLNIISHVSILDAVERKRFPAKDGITNGIWQFPNLPIADAFREDKADIDALRSGLKSRSDIVQIPFEQVARKKMSEAVSIHKMVAEGNAELESVGLPATITKSDIAQDTDMPQQAEQGPIVTDGTGTSDALINTIGIGGTQALVQIQQQIASGILDRETGIATLMNVFGVTREQAEAMAPQKGSATPKEGTENITPIDPGPTAQAAMAAYMGDVLVSELPESTQAEIAAILGTNGNTGSLKVIKYGMTVAELLKMADPDNLEAARKRLKYCTNGACADEVHANTEKHVIVQNNRVIDGCHFIARSEKGKVTRSLPVIDISPARFQVSV